MVATQLGDRIFLGVVYIYITRIFYLDVFQIHGDAMYIQIMRLIPSRPETPRKMYANRTFTFPLESLRGVIIPNIQGVGIVNAAQKVCS